MSSSYDALFLSQSYDSSSNDQCKHPMLFFKMTKDRYANLNPINAKDSISFYNIFISIISFQVLHSPGGSLLPPIVEMRDLNS